MNGIYKFLEDFYKTISFECGEMFKAEEFRLLFDPNAMLVEKVEDRFIQKTIEEHITQFETTIRDYPELFIKGFHEVQIHCDMIESEKCYLVCSEYRKAYSRNNEEVVEYGKNNMIVIYEGNCFKIVSIVW